MPALDYLTRRHIHQSAKRRAIREFASGFVPSLLVAAFLLYLLLY